MKITREPALWVGLISTILTSAAAMGMPGLNAAQAASLVALIGAITVAIFTRPIAPALFLGAFATFVAFMAEYGLHWSDAQVGAVASLIVAAFTFFGVRPQVDPTTASGKVVEGEIVGQATVPR